MEKVLLGIRIKYVRKKITDPFTDSTKYGVETFLNDKKAKWLTDRCPFKTPVTLKSCEIPKYTIQQIELINT